MSYKKRIPVTAAALALLLTPALPAMAQTTTTAADRTAFSKAVAAPASIAQAAKRKSIKCIRPGGKKSNYSWKNGTASTTVYFNNHCSHRVYVTVHFKGPFGTDTKCLSTNGGTKGKKKFGKGTMQKLVKITKEC
ncbi:hypothetical protein ABZ897_23605 [Nonomuraea sp. NPDC046802]|uniref:hypothetical protein n=1 Tax=Nonomuraea sp. NPDC046802 TaxID=3154919 RepID=UPI0033ED717C